jgi:hypothetical protein
VETTDYPGQQAGGYTVTIQSGHEINDNNIGILDFGDLIIYGWYRMDLVDTKVR